MTTLRKISELATVTTGFSPKPFERKKSGKYLLIGGRNLKEGQLVTTDADSYVGEIDRESFRRAIAKPRDVIVSTLFDRRKIYLYDKDDPPAVVNNSCAIIRAGEQSDYIISYLRSAQGASDFLEKASKATSGRFIPRVLTKDLGEIEIPILPIEKLVRLGDARIEKASTKQLLELQQELESKNAEIEGLRSSQAGVVRFYEDRLQAVREQFGDGQSHQSHQAWRDSDIGVQVKPALQHPSEQDG
jgi:restriction endonuclease S subunit